MVRLTKYKLFHGIGSVSTLAFIMLVLTLLLPIISNGANAEGEVSDRASTRINISSSPVVSIALDKSVSLEFTPKVSGEFQQSSAKLTVSTNNTDGYRILLSSSNNNAALTSTSQTAKINSIVGMNVLPAAFTDNTWGYSLVNASTTPTSYNAVPTTDTEILNVETGKVIEGHADTYDLNFGARVSTSLPAGNYSGEVVVSAVANPIKLHSLMDVTYMQDMTSSICANTPILEDKKNPVSKQLIDTRDGKKYWVSKLADGNCWMVQNLALDIPATGLKAADTDITTDWNQSSQYPPTVTETSIPVMVEGGGPATSTRSWNLGDYVLVAPKDNTLCLTPTPPNAESPSDNRISGRPGDNIFNYCKNIVNVANTRWQPGYQATAGQNWTPLELENTVIAVKPNNINDLNAGGTYDAHYLAGNYYQWNTATAGTGGTQITANKDNPVNASNSICPKNWRLPTSQMSTYSLDSKYGPTFYKLLKLYGYDFFDTPVATDEIRTPAISPDQEYNLALAPFYYTRSGIIQPQAGAFHRLGFNANAWSASAATILAHAFGAGMNSNDLYIGATDRYLGYVVRCIVR